MKLSMSCETNRQDLRSSDSVQCIEFLKGQLHKRNYFKDGCAVAIQSCLHDHSDSIAPGQLNIALFQSDGALIVGR